VINELGNKGVCPKEAFYSFAKRVFIFDWMIGFSRYNRADIIQL